MQNASRSLVQTALDDPEAFAAIVDHHKAMVFSVAYHFLQDRELAEDLAQDVFLELFRHLNGIESDAHLTFWLRRATCNKCIDHGRCMKNRGHTSLEQTPEPGVEPRLPDPYLADTIRKAVLTLPEGKRLIVILRFQEDLELSEISRLLKMPINTVKSSLHRALALLKEKLSVLDRANHYGTTRA